MSELDAFFADAKGPPAEDERVNGRYRLTDPNTGHERSWMTASNYGFPLEDQHGLQRWRARKLLRGLGQRQDLLDMLATMPPDEVDNGKLDEIIETALQVAATSADANRGTAVHDALRAADEGRSYPATFEPHVRAYRAALARFGLRVVLVETLGVNPTVGGAGKLDRVYAEADGSLVIGDIKTSGRLELGAHSFSVQACVYQGFSHIKSGGQWMDAPPTREDYAVVVHVDRDTGAVSVYRVDLQIGRHGANLAEQVRGWRKSGPVLLPYVAPAVPMAARQAAEVQGATRDPFTVDPVIQADRLNEGSVDGTRRLFDGRVQVFQLGEWMDTDGLTDAARAIEHQPSGPLAQDIAGAGVPFPVVDPEMNGASNVASDPLVRNTEAYDEAANIYAPNVPRLLAALPGTSMTIAPTEHGGVIQPEPAPLSVGLRTAADVMKMSKTEAQTYCRTVDPDGVGRDLAHTKKVLVEMLAKAGKLAPAGTVAAPAHRADPPSERPGSDIFRRLQLGRIQAATTVGDLQVLRNEIVKRHGDQAWTDELTEAARAKVAEIDSRPISQESNNTYVPNALDRIAAFTETEDLKRFWEEVTLGGSLPGNWTPELDQASRARLTELTNARPPAPANPFAGS